MAAPFIQNAAITFYGSTKVGEGKLANHMLLMSGVIVPGSTYWNLGFGLDKGDVAKDEEAARNMADLGQTIAWLGKAIQGQAPSRPVALVREG